MISGLNNTETITDVVHLPTFNMRVTFNTEATPAQAIQTIEGLCTALSRQEASMQHLRILLGRVLVQIQDKELYRPEYSSFEQFLQAAVKKVKLAKSDLWVCMSIAEIPRIEPAEAEKMPYTNLGLLARAAKHAEPQVLAEIRKDAAKLKIVEYRHKLESKGLLPRRGRPDGRKRRGPITIHVTLPSPVARLWRELDEPVEAFSEWLKKYAEKALRAAA